MNLKEQLPGQTKLLGATRKSIEAADHLTATDVGGIKMLLKVAERLDALYADPDTSKLVKEGNLQFLYAQLLDKLLLTPASRAASVKKAGGKTEDEEALEDIRASR